MVIFKKIRRKNKTKSTSGNFKFFNFFTLFNINNLVVSKLVLLNYFIYNKKHLYIYLKGEKNKTEFTISSRSENGGLASEASMGAPPPPLVYVCLQIYIDTIDYVWRLYI